MSSPDFHAQINFVTEGRIPSEAFEIMGVSVKPNTTTPIGMFGTGLKYAISIVLRTGGTFIMTYNDETYFFGVKKTYVRGTDFNVVTKNGVPLPFTLDYGKHWDTWMAYRELASNTKDEKGVIEIGSIKERKADHTYITVHHPELVSYHLNRDSIFLSETLKRSPFLNLEHINKPTKYLFYRGVRVHTFNDTFYKTYNITADINLTEDRTIASEYIAINMIANSITNNDDISAKDLEDILLCGRQYEEHSLNYSSLSFGASETFIAVMRKIKAEGKLALVAPSAVNLFKKYSDEDIDFTPTELTPLENARLQVAMEMVDKEVPTFDKSSVIVVEDLGRNVLGKVFDGKIYLARTILTRELHLSVSTLLEEAIHVSTGFLDETRELQTHLFDLLAFKLIQQWEQDTQTRLREKGVFL